MEKDAKICFLFKLVEHSDLKKSIEALKSHMETNPSGKVPYTTEANHLSTAVSEFTEYVFGNRSMSAVSTGCGYQNGAYKSDRTTNTAYIHNRRFQSNADKKKVIDERKKQRVKLGDGKESKTVNELDNIKELKKQNPKFKRKIKAIKKNVTNDHDKGDDNDKPEDSGDQFGGKQSKEKCNRNGILGLHY